MKNKIKQDVCCICKGGENVGKQKLLFEDSKETICVECLAKLKGFEKWIQDGNVIHLGNEIYQDTKNKNRLEGVYQLVNYFKKIF